MQSTPKDPRRTSKMAKGILTVLAIGTVVFLGFQAYVYSAKPSPVTRDVSGENEQAVITANTKFATELYGLLSKSNEKDNIFFSPFSISTALAMTLLGARGETERQMMLAMALDKVRPRGSLHGVYSHLLTELLSKDNDNYILRLANRIFLQDGYNIQELFSHETHKFYAASSKTLDFHGNTDGARSSINQWVQQETDDNIKELIKPDLLKPETRFVIVNAIYFKGAWQFKFDKEKTRPQDFFTSELQSQKVDMMYQKADFYNGYNSELDGQVLELPHAGSSLVMTILLPKEKFGLKALQEKLIANPQILGKVHKTLSNTSTEVLLPKFSMTCDYEMIDVLREMGMVDLFDEGKADLSGISVDNDLYVGHVAHKAHVEVNEEGSQAAAASAVVGVARLAARTNVFRADHPFLFYVTDSKTNALIFVGRYSNPGEQSNSKNRRVDL